MRYKGIGPGVQELHLYSIKSMVIFLIFRQYWLNVGIAAQKVGVDKIICRQK